jgi:hypothetical protein
MNKLSLSPSDIPKLFPDFVVHTGIRYWELKTLPAEVPLPSRLKDAVWRRQADYVSGRLCAQEALNRLGAAALNVAHHAPRIPKPIKATDQRTIADDDHFFRQGDDFQMPVSFT